MPNFIVEIHHESRKQFIVRAPTAEAALIPIEQLYRDHSKACRVIHFETRIANVTKQTKKERQYEQTHRH